MAILNIEEIIRPQINDLDPDVAYFVEAGLRRILSNGRISALQEMGVDDEKISSMSPSLAFGVCLFEAGCLQHSVKHLKSIEADVEDQFQIANVLIASALKARGSNRAAIARFLSIPFGSYPSELRAAVFKGLASAHRDLGLQAEAVQYLDKALEESPGNYRYLFSKGYLYQHTDARIDSANFASNLERSESFYESAIESGGENWSSLHHHLAIVKFSLGKRDSALSHIVASLRLYSTFPTNYDFLNKSLGMIMMESASEGISLLRNNVHKFDDDPVRCALKNARQVISLDAFASSIESELQAYISILEDRLDDLRSRDMYQDGEWNGRPYQVNAASAAAIVSFIDLRGFTEWVGRGSQAGECNIAGKLSEFYGFAWEAMRPVSSYTKLVGDGLMIIARLYGDSIASVAEQLRQHIEALHRLLEAYETHSLNLDEGLELGIGVAWGEVIKLKTRHGNYDYLGVPVNLAARLCDQARPKGMVLAMDPVNGVGNYALNGALSLATSGALAKAMKEDEVILKGVVGAVKVLRLG